MSLFYFEEENPENNIGAVLGPIGSTLAMFFFLSPAITLYNLYKKTVDPKTVPWFMMIANVLNCIFWFVYGIQLNNKSMWICNIIGLVLNLIWLTAFWFFFFEKIGVSIISAVITIAGSLGLVALYYWGIDVPDVSGYSALVFNILMYAAPGQNVFKVVSTRDYKLIPIVATSIGLLCSTTWFLFGLIGMLRANIQVIIPNGLGILFSIINIILWAYFYTSAPKTNELGAHLKSDMA